MSPRFYGPLIENGISHLHSYSNPFPSFPALTHVHEARCLPTHTLPPHIHETFEIVYIAAGRGQWRIENQNYDLRFGDLLLIQPGELHDGHADQKAPYTTLIAGFDPAYLPMTSHRPAPLENDHLQGRLSRRKAQGILVWNPPLRDLSQAAEQVQVLDAALGGSTHRVLPGAFGAEPIFRRILDELDRPINEHNPEASQTLQVMMVQTLLIELLIFIARHQLELSQPPQNMPRAATPELCGWLGQQLSQPPTVQEMAERAHLSVAHFSVAFKSDTGMTPLEYMTNLRIEAAARRLRAEREVPITQIAFDFGFSSSQYFSVVFQKVKGVLPSQWRSGETA